MYFFCDMFCWEWCQGNKCIIIACIIETFQDDGVSYESRWIGEISHIAYHILHNWNKGVHNGVSFLEKMPWFQDVCGCNLIIVISNCFEHGVKNFDIDFDNDVLLDKYFDLGRPKEKGLKRKKSSWEYGNDSISL